MPRFSIVRYALMAFVVGLFGLGASDHVSAQTSGGHECSESKMTVFSTDPNLAVRICDVVAAIDPLLTRCGLPDSGPVTLYVTKRIEGTGGHPLGVYLHETDEIAVIDPVVLGEHDGRGAIFDKLATDVLFDSLVVHEITHFRLSHATAARSISLVDQEYIAYAMQLASLPAKAREALLAEFSGGGADAGAISEVALTFAPAFFATRAWLHFNETGNGCVFVKSLINGDFSFGRLEP